jgi:hypothetical protein
MPRLFTASRLVLVFEDNDFFILALTFHFGNHFCSLDSGFADYLLIIISNQ